MVRVTDPARNDLKCEIKPKTVKIPKNQTSNKNAVISLKIEQCGFIPNDKQYSDLSLHWLPIVRSDCHYRTFLVISALFST